MKLARFFIDNYKFTMVLMVGFVLFGISGLLTLKSETFPTVDLGNVIVTTVYPGASADDVESKITKPIEDEIRTVRGLKEVKSISQAGLSRIFTVVDIDRYNVEEVVSDLQRAVDRTPDLPQDLENPPSFFEMKSEEFPVIELAIVGPNEGRLRDRVAYELKEELEDNKAISTITLSGYRERQFNILVNREKLDQFHVGLNEVGAKVAAQNVNIPGGNIENGSSQKILRIEGKLKSSKELEKLVVRSNFTGEKITLLDIAEVIDGEEDAETLTLYEGEPATLLTIAKKGGTDIIELSNQVKALVSQFESKYEGKLKFKIFNDEGVRVSNRLSILSSNGLVGLMLVIFFLLVFLPGRAGVMASLSLPLAVLATFGYMAAVGMTLNTITILAMVICLGMLVDNAVVIAENYARLKDEGHSPKDAAIISIDTLWLPITATALTTIAAFLPMLVTKGIIGQFIRGIPIVVTVALLISLAESFFLLPVRLITRKEGGSVNADQDWFTRKVVGPFSKVTYWLVNRRYIAAAIFSFLIFGSLFMMVGVNKFILFPADQTEIYIARVELEKDGRIETMNEKLSEISKEVRAVLGENVAHITSKAGLSEVDFGDPKSMRGENVGMLFIFMTVEAKDTLQTNSVLEKLRSIKVDGLQDLSFEAAINGPPLGAPVTAIFRSNRVESIDEVTSLVMKDLKNTEGVFDVRLDDVYGADEIYVNILQQEAARLGLDLATIGATLRMAMAGEIITDVTLNNHDVNYFVRFEGDHRLTKENLAQVKIMDRQSNLIPITKVAQIVEKESVPQVKRFDFKRAKTVTANINDDIITAIDANQVVGASFAKIKDQYKDVSLEFGGEGERTEESMQSLAQALVLSIIGIFALLVFLFNSYVRPLIILTTIPLGLVGVALSFFLHDRPISFLAMIGVVGLGGIIVNSGIVLISFIEDLRKDSTESLTEILVKATGLRLRAVIVTSLTTVCGLLPTAYGIGGADEFIIPMTLAMAWGLVSGTLLALLWVPCAYAITEDMSHYWQNLKSRWRAGSFKKRFSTEESMDLGVSK